MIQRQSHDDDFNIFAEEGSNEGGKERDTLHPSILVAALVITVAALPFALMIIIITLNQKDDDDTRRLTMIDEDEPIPDIFPFRWPQDYLGFGFAVLGLLLASSGVWRWWYPNPDLHSHPWVSCC